MIKYLKGDATEPQGAGTKFIIHVVNDRGGWGAGFVLALSRKWKGPEQSYRKYSPLTLGQIQVVPVERHPGGVPYLYVVNMCAQTGYGRGNRNLHRTNEPDDQIPLRYDALQTCLEQVAEEATVLGAAIHAPRFGCGLAGGKWELVEPIIQSALEDLPVFIYDLP